MIGMQVSQADDERVKCYWRTVSGTKQEFQAFLQHSRRSSHVLISSTRYIDKQPHFFTKFSNSWGNVVIDVDDETGNRPK